MEFITVNSTDSFAGAVYNEMKAMPFPTENEENWSLAALRFYEYSCFYENIPLTHKNLSVMVEETSNILRQEIPDDQERMSVVAKMEEVAHSTFQRSNWTMKRTLKNFLAAIAIEMKLKGGDEWVKAAKLVEGLKEDNCMLTQQMFEYIKGKILGDMAEGFSKQCIQEAGLLVDELFAKGKWTNVLTQGGFDRLLPLYRKMQQAEPLDRDNEDQWPSTDHPFSMKQTYTDIFDWRNLEVTLPIEEIEEIYQRNGIVQLRPIPQDADTLIIGCGSGRISNAGQSSFAYQASEYDREYSLEHLHRGAVTIDPSLSANATVVAPFGDLPLAKLFQGKKFSWIVFEGFFDHSKQKYRDEDVKALLAPEGSIILDHGTGYVHLNLAYFEEKEE